jgi:UDP-galactopyranose mutase
MTSDLQHFDNDQAFDVVCFSHLRWDFVFQRPQHLMTRFANTGRVFVIEEPVVFEGEPYIHVSERGESVFVCVPYLPAGNTEQMPELVEKLLSERSITRYIAWFYTPMMLGWSSRLKPLAVVYDCMDQLSAFKNAPPELMERERQLFGKADVVFTGGRSLYEAKKNQHDSVHAFPSSIDVKHFSQAMQISSDIPEQAEIRRPRIGFVGVIDERTDIELLSAMAELRKDWSFVMVGPVVKISDEDLPRRDNIHYLGQRSYDDLPAILAGWDAAMMPFALNESTRYISPTKTPEYLAAGLPVVSTPIADVIDPYGNMGLVHIASTPEEFVDALAKAMEEDGDVRREKATEFLSRNSWDRTFDAMYKLITNAIDSHIEKDFVSTEASA